MAKIDASWVVDKVVHCTFQGGGRATPHVLGPSAAWEEAFATVPAELVPEETGKIRVEYSRVWGCGGSTYRVVRVEPGCRETELEVYQTLADARSSSYLNVFRAVSKSCARQRLNR